MFNAGVADQVFRSAQSKLFPDPGDKNRTITVHFLIARRALHSTKHCDWLMPSRTLDYGL
jgi:hypothetical protein